MPPSTQTRTIKIVVDAPGVKSALDGISKSMGNLNKNTKSIADSFGFLKNAFTGYFSALGVREIVRMSDEMQNLGNRLKIVSREGENTQDIMQSMLGVANETKQSLSSVAEVYTRLGSSLKSANASSESLLALTKSLINSFVISGSTGTETTATIIQLSQAFASGTLRGQELRSVLLQNAELAKLLRERFGADLAKKAEAGLISVTEVLKLLRDNMTRINTTAKAMTPTFEQTVTRAFNKAQLALSRLNTEFKLAEKFAAGMEALSDTVFTLARAMADLAAVIAGSDFFKALAISVGVVVASFFPLQAVLAGVLVLAIKTSDSMGELIDKFRNLGAWAVQLNIWFLELSHTIDKEVARALFKVGLGTDEMVRDLAAQIDEINRLVSIADNLGTTKYAPSPLDPNKKKNNEKKAIDDLIAAYNKVFQQMEKAKKSKEELAELNAEFLMGTMTVRDYGAELISLQAERLKKDFKDGKLNLLQFNDAMEKTVIGELNLQFREGTITVEKYNAAITNLQIENLNKKFEAGTVSLVEYSNELTKISQKFEPTSALVAGTNSYIQSVGTMSSNIADGIKRTFGALEDALFDFVKTGKFNFADFTQSVLDDLTRIIIRASIIRPIAEGILGAPFTLSGPTVQPASLGPAPGTMVAAKGYAFDKGIRKFASGGIVDGPTMFSYGNGRPGLMGEAGPEAIIPLRRGSGGELGVSASVTPVTVNVINQTGSEVQQRETTGPNGERTLDIIITGKVREGLLSGKYDKAMKSAYGVSRKGA